VGTLRENRNEERVPANASTAAHTIRAAHSQQIAAGQGTVMSFCILTGLFA
jgi:hypothetical protein